MEPNLESKEEVLNALIKCFETGVVKHPNKEGFVTYDTLGDSRGESHPYCFYYSYTKRGYLSFEVHCCPKGFQHSTCGLQIDQYGKADLYFKDGIKSPAYKYTDIVHTLIMYLEALKEFIESHEDQVRERMEVLFNELEE